MSSALGTSIVTVAADRVRVDLALPTYTPVLIDAGPPNSTSQFWGEADATSLRLPTSLSLTAKTSPEFPSRGSRLSMSNSYAIVFRNTESYEV